MFRDADDAVGVVWYPAQKGAPVLGMPSVIAVPDWDDIYWDWEGSVGEYTAPRTYSNEKPKVFADYDHVCGTEEDFREGCLFDADSPEVKYGAQGLPACCNPVVVAAGGVVVGGSGDVAFIPPPLVYGGLAVGGAGDVVYYPPGPAAGSSCSDAPVVALEATIADTAVAGEEHWWQFVADGVSDYTVVLAGATDADLALSLQRGTCPAPLIPVIGFHTLGSDTWLFPAPPAGPVWVSWSSASFAGDYSFVITPV